MDDATKNRWDVGLGFATTIIAVVGLLVGVFQFTREQTAQTKLQYELQARENRVAFQRTLWLEQLGAYRKIADVVGRLVTHLDQSEMFEAAVTEFHAMYWGEMVLVEDQDVETAMIQLRRELHDLTGGWSNKKRVKTRALELLATCKASTRSTLDEIDALEAQ